MFFILPLPPGINATYGTNKSGNFYKKTKAKDWEEIAGWKIKQVASAKRRMIAEKCGVKLLVCFDPLHEPDIDAYIKITLDLLQRQSLVKNDKLVWDLQVKKFIDADHPRIEVTIS